MPLKEVLCGGIAALSTDFHQMGRTMASLLLDTNKPVNVPTLRNPWVFLPRQSI